MREGEKERRREGVREGVREGGVYRCVIKAEYSD